MRWLGIAVLFFGVSASAKLADYKQFGVDFNSSFYIWVGKASNPSKRCIFLDSTDPSSSIKEYRQVFMDNYEKGKTCRLSDEPGGYSLACLEPSFGAAFFRSKEACIDFDMKFQKSKKSSDVNKPGFI